MKTLRIIILSGFFLQLLQGGASAGEARKIAYMNAVKVIDNYHKTKEADSQLEAESNKKTAEREKLVEKINKLRDEVELLAKDAREKKENELNDAVRGLQDFDREVTTTLKRKSDDYKKEILKEIDDVIKDYGRKNGYDLILDSRTLLYANDAIDVSNDIISTLNKAKQ